MSQEAVIRLLVEKGIITEELLEMVNQALVWNVGTCRSDDKGETQVGGPHEGESTDAGHRGGITRSSDEVS